MVMAADWLAAQGLGASTRINGKRNDTIFTGQADGLQCRTLEVSLRAIEHFVQWGRRETHGNHPWQMSLTPSSSLSRRFLPLDQHVLHSFGFADRIWKESNHMIDIVFWNPDDDGGKLRRTGRIPGESSALSLHASQAMALSLSRCVARFVMMKPFADC